MSPNLQRNVKIVNQTRLAALHGERTVIDDDAAQSN